MKTYRGAGVDQDAADALVPYFAKLGASTRRVECISDVGGFGGLFSLEGVSGRKALVCSTDGVGTKVELLAREGRHRTAGWDAVAMNVDDVVCAGAEPLFCVDYVSVERLGSDVVKEIVGGVADACTEAGCALLGGETSQHPGLLPPGGYDVVATCVGLVDLDRTWGPERVREGDQVVGLASSGLHANGFSLVRALIQPGEPLPEGLLEPTAIYARKLLALAGSVEIHAAAHVTGGGIPGNLARVLPAGLGATIDTRTWPRPDVFRWLSSNGVSDDELWATFNCGLGMLVVTPDGDGAVAHLGQAGVDAWVVGTVRTGTGVTLTP